MEGLATSRPESASCWKSETASAGAEYVLFVAAVVVPLGALFFWLMNALISWFRDMLDLIQGPFL